MAKNPATRVENPVHRGAQGWAMHRHRTAAWWEFSAAARIARAAFVSPREAKARRQSRAKWDRRETGTCNLSIHAARPYLGATDPGDIYRRAASHRRWDRSR